MQYAPDLAAEQAAKAPVWQPLQIAMVSSIKSFICQQHIMSP
jgi:hypothetical protein